MELLGAVAELLLLLWKEREQEESECRGAVDEDVISTFLCALACAAGAFPAEFQAALGNAGAAGPTGAGAQGGADDCAAAAGGSSGASGATACVSMSVVQALLACVELDAELHALVTRVLGGGVPTTQEVQELTSACFEPQELSRKLRVLLPPAEARAAVASAAAAAAAAAPAVS